jgi:hypothetical protein
MEIQIGILWESAKEQLEEGIHVLGSIRRIRDIITICRVRETNVGRLIQENDVGFLVPRVRVESSSISSFIDNARTEFHEKTG